MTHDTIHKCTMLEFKKAMQGDYSEMGSGLLVSERQKRQAFIKVFDEADNKFNIASIYKKYLSLMVVSVGMFAKGVSGQRHYMTRAILKKAEADMLLNAGISDNFEIACAKLSKKVGFRISPKDITVAEFYSYAEIEA